MEGWHRASCSLAWASNAAPSTVRSVASILKRDLSFDPQIGAADARIIGGRIDVVADVNPRVIIYSDMAYFDYLVGPVIFCYVLPHIGCAAWTGRPRPFQCLRKLQN